MAHLADFDSHVSASATSSQLQPFDEQNPLVKPILDGMERKPNPLGTFDEAVPTLKFKFAALQSAHTGESVFLTRIRKP
jgi:hypothetical protein